MADEYTWDVVDGRAYPLNALPNIDIVENTSKYLYQSSPYMNEGYPYNGYMVINKEYPALKPAANEYIELLDRVQVYSPPHGLDAIFPVTEMEIPLNAPENTRYKLGKTKKVSLTSANNAQNENFKKQLLTIPKASSILQSAKENAAVLINDATKGYVTMRRGEDGNVEELIISDTPDYKESKNMWIWNRHGLGFSSQGYQPDEFDLALTSDGHIVADMVTTGTMRADRIRGGELKVGGVEYQIDGDGNPILTRDDRDARVFVIQTEEGEDEYGYPIIKEIRSMGLGGGQIFWEDYTDPEGARHVGHLDVYGTPQYAEFPWLSLVTVGGLMLNVNNLGVMRDPDGDYIMCPDYRNYTVLDMSGSTSEEEPTSIDVVTDIEIDEETGKIKSVKKKNLTLRKLEFTHGLHTDITVDPR